MPTSDDNAISNQDSTFAKPDQKTRPTKEPQPKEERPKTEPDKANPAKSEGSKTEPVKPGPAKGQPGKPEAGKEQPGKAESGKEQPAKTELTKTGPAKSGATKQDAPKQDPTKSQPLKSEPTGANATKLSAAMDKPPSRTAAVEQDQKMAPSEASKPTSTPITAKPTTPAPATAAPATANPALAAPTTAKPATTTPTASAPTTAAPANTAAPATATPAAPPAEDTRLISSYDLHLFNEGNHTRLYEKFGAHPTEIDGQQGTYFGVWAPDAERISIVGDFNNWKPDATPMTSRGSSGVWDCFVPGLSKGAVYKYFIRSRYHGYAVAKADPYGYYCETPPKTASIVWDTWYEWQDQEWMNTRQQKDAFDAPMSIYEVHLGSWMRVPEEGNRSLTYRELAHKLTDYVKQLGFTHVEFMPIMEHPFFGSWGYQITGYFAPSSRFGTPQDFMYLVDHLHQNGIGVILDWVPSHFPNDEHGLAYFDGTHLYEHADPRRGFHPDWKSSIFNYGRNEVRAFLVSNAMFWLDRYHIDGLRMDAIASMLYLDYSRKQGEWIPNQFGGRENLEAVAFLKQVNQDAYQQFPGIQTIAEESTAWPMVSRPPYIGGLGFGMKWDMGWMHDTLLYFSKDPIHRKYHHSKLTFRGLYMFTENYVLPLSHDEVVYGKGSLIGKMAGDEWQRFANLRLLFGYMYTQAGKKLVFMGGEIAQTSEWSHDGSLAWDLLRWAPHQGVQRWVSDLNAYYRKEPALYQLDFSPDGWQWIDADDSDNSVLTYMRYGRDRECPVLVACNFTPMPRRGYRVGVPFAGHWREMLNSNAAVYGGTDEGNFGGVASDPIPYHGQPQSLLLNLPPLSIVIFKR